MQHPLGNLRYIDKELELADFLTISHTPGVAAWLAEVPLLGDHLPYMRVISGIYAKCLPIGRHTPAILIYVESKIG